MRHAGIGGQSEFSREPLGRHVARKISVTDDESNPFLHVGVKGYVTTIAGIYKVAPFPYTMVVSELVQRQKGGHDR